MIGQKVKDIENLQLRESVEPVDGNYLAQASLPPENRQESQASQSTASQNNSLETAKALDGAEVSATPLLEAKPQEKADSTRFAPMFSSGFDILIFVLLSLITLLFPIKLQDMPAEAAMTLSSLTAIPWQLVWTIWLLDINNLAGKALKRRPPVSPFEIILVSTLGFFARPPALMEQSSCLTYVMQDPFMWVWLFSQFWLYLRVAPYILGLPGNKPRWGAGFGLGVLATAFASITILFCQVIAPLLGVCLRAFDGFIYDGIFCMSTSLIYQSAALALLSFRLRTGQNKASGEQKKKDARRQIEQNAEQLSIPYQAFAGLERFCRRSIQLKGRSLLECLLVAFAIPLSTTIYVIGCNSYSPQIARLFDGAGTGITAKKVIERSLSGNRSYLDAGAGSGKRSVSPRQQLEKDANKALVTSFMGLISILLAGGVLVFVSRPTRLVLGRRGIRLLRMREGIPGDGWIEWKTITRIELSRTSNQAAAADGAIVFRRTNGNSLKIPLSALETAEQKEALLKGIRLYGQDIQRDPRLEELLERPANYSYTELWLQALSAAPRRERLKPLSAESKLAEGKYTVEKTLGAGGQGHAYLAFDHEHACKVVLKEFILPVYVELDVRKSALAQFENEARILKSLEHERIVQLRDFFVEDHRAYLVLEHIEGVSLQQYVREKGPLSGVELLDLSRQMCEILKYLHSQSPPVVHRDFTPDNLILSEDGTLKLIDFNVAKQSETGSLGTVVGKHAYMPPEQFRGETVAQSDIYSMGASLYFLASGHEPEPISQSSLKGMRADLSVELKEIIEKATATELEKRIENIDELAVLLEEVQKAQAQAQAQAQAARTVVGESSEESSAVADEYYANQTGLN